MKVLDNIKFFIDSAKKPAQVASTTPSTKKILVVDDELAYSAPLSIKLKSEGYEVVNASNGKEGLEKALSDKPDLIVLDIIMPIMDGKSMISKLREYEQFKALPVVMLSNEGEITNIKQTEIYYSASKFFIKANVTIDEIVEEVKRLV